MFTPLLLNAARAYALVAFADGRLSTEELRFSSFVASEPALKDSARVDVAAAWKQAVIDVEASKSFGGPLVSIRTEITLQPERLLIMRAAQAALVADKILDPQEDAAIRSLAEALKLNPGKY